MEKKKMLFVIVPLFLIIVSILVFFGYFKRNLSGPVDVSATSIYGKASVFVNDSLVGDTPYKGQIDKKGELKISLRGEYNTYDVKLNPAPGTEIALKRDLGSSSNFSSGQVVWMEKIQKKDPQLSVVSNNAKIKIKIDGKEVGESPFTTEDTTLIGENKIHKLEFTKDGYEGQELDLETKSGYKVNILVDMFLFPVSENPTEIAESTATTKIYAITSPGVTEKNIDTKTWAQGLSYFKNTRGRGLPEFSYFVDEEGLTFGPSGETVVLDDIKKVEGPLLILGYLTKNGGVISEKALVAINNISSDVATTGEGLKQVKILETGADFGLNVRSGAGVTFEKVTTIPVGSTHTVLEEQGEWFKIKVDGIEGWINSSYTEEVTTKVANP